MNDAVSRARVIEDSFSNLFQELCAIFTAVNPEFNVVSHKVLKDSLGMSRGVGFAR